MPCVTSAGFFYLKESAMKGCRVNISVYFAVLIACIVVLDQTGFAVLALFCAALHESGHFAALWLYRAPVEEVSFKSFGVNIRLAKKTRLSYRQELAVALSGCAANIIFCLISLAFYKAGFFVNKTQPLFYMNLILCTFNLLPIGPLDGGRALELFLSGHIQYDATRNIVDAVSIILIVPLAFLGIYLLTKTGYNFSLMLAAAYLAASVILKGRLIEIG
jgi:stage IV sporulation protein FB